MSLRRKLSVEDQAALDQHEEREQSARKLRESVARFRTRFSLQGLRAQLPLCFPSARAQPLSFRALSWYTYPGWVLLTVRAQLEVLTPFYVALWLIDFAPLRAELVALTEIHLNAAGQTPFDPVSLFLCCLLRWEKGMGWKSLAKLLAGPEGACWRKLFGFRDWVTPGASTLRRFYKAVGPAFQLDLCPRFIELIQTAGLLPIHSTHPRAPARQGLPIAADGMLHEAHCSMRCGQVTDSCYQPTSAQHPRPCPAREKGFDGCSCTEKECAQRCRYTTPRDALARLIHYSGTNQEGEQDSSRARNVYGWRSYPQVLCDDELHAYWVAYASVHSANTDERHILPNDFAYLGHRLSQLQIGELVADSAAGYADCLNPLYDAGLVPVIAIRRDKHDQDAQTCQLRGYDRNGRPHCAHGYPMLFNGVDYQRLRTCWVCRQICSQQRPPRPEDTTCPYREPRRPLGMVTHVGRAFIHPDGSHHARLARLYPYGSALWKERYGARKNAVEGRNSQITRLGLKRIWSYGLPGATADLCFADLLINLHTLGRLVQQVTLLVS
jgi:hypothetical protein